MEQLLDQIRTWRRHLHAIPEIGFQEYKTSKYLYEELEKMGIQDGDTVRIFDFEFEWTR